jgi:hypothetical protein
MRYGMQSPRDVANNNSEINDEKEEGIHPPPITFAVDTFCIYNVETASFSQLKASSSMM